MEQQLAYSFHLGSDKNKSKLAKKVAKENVSGTTSLANNAIQNAKDLSDINKHNLRDYDNQRKLIRTIYETNDIVNDIKQLYLEEFEQKDKNSVKGINDMAVRFSKCCNPVPGDEIVGFVTRGRGVSIHRTDCINIINLSDMERERLIDAEWQHDEESGNSGLYLAEIKVFCNNRTGLLVDITRAFTERAIDINAIHSKTSKQGIATIDISFNTKGKAELTSVIDKLRQIDSIIDIERTTG